MTPSRKHEAYKEFLARVVYALGDALDVNVESVGSATWKRREDLRGTEPDACFYVANAERVLGDREIDLSVDPPPDIVVEIDVSNESLSKLPIYAAFGVPEIWRYDATHNQLLMYELRGGSYVEVPGSHAFPILTAEALAGFIERSKAQGQTTALSGLRERLRTRPPL